MSDKALTDAIAALARSQLLTVDVLRQTQATTQIMAERLGRICDQNAEIIKQMDAFGMRQNDSERKLRAVESSVADVQRRLAPLEAHYQAYTQSASR